MTRPWNLLALALAVLDLTAASNLRAQTPTLVPGELRCEYRENPLGVDLSQPRLGWIINPAAPNLRGLQQKAYQVLVATSPALLARDQGDLWDSGRVASDQMNQLAYAGKPLASGQTVFWKVRLWDQANVPSAWSTVAAWAMGLLHEADWQGARWIGAPDANQPFDPKGGKERKAKYETVLLRRGFSVKPGLRRALVHLCGLGQYELTLNGAKVGDAVFTPGWTAYHKTCLYDAYDVTAALRPGANALGVFLGNGFYNIHNERYTKIRGSYGPLQAIGLLRLEYADGTVENVVTDDQWRVATGPVVMSSVYGGEDYDARLLPEGWGQPGFADGDWERPAVTKGPGGTLRGISAASPPVRVVQTLTPVGKRQINPNVTVYDLGQNAAILAAIRVRGPAGATVKVTPSELVHDNGDINERMCKNNSFCTYTLSGKGEESNAWRFYYRGGRYLRVETIPAPGNPGLPEVLAVEGRVIRSDAPVVGQFACSNEMFNRTVNLVRWAQISNMMSVMTDCPHREKLGWLEQIHLNGPALRYNFDMSTMFTKMVNDMADAQRPNGLVPSTVPDYLKGGEGKFINPIEWGSACILVPWQQYEFEGDRKLLADNYEVMKRYLEYIAKRSPTNLVTFGLGDWYDNLSEGEPTLTPVPLTSTAFYYQNHRVLARIARILDKPEEADRLEQKAADVLKTFNDKFFVPTTGDYAQGSQGANCLPLAMGLAAPEARPALLENLVKDLGAKGMKAGEVSFRYLLRALADGGRSDFLYQTFNTDTNGYGLQLKLGKTSLTEAWNGGRSSQNHFMFGQINEWFYHDLAGIQPDPAGPGFQRIVIKPAPVGDLTFVKASYRSIRGNIVSHWTRGPGGSGGLTMNVTVPVGATATVYVPDSGATTPNVKESGVPAASAPGVKFLRMENGAAVYAVGSGSYRFTSAGPRLAQAGLPPAPR